jgi:hypothetical protein
MVWRLLTNTNRYFYIGNFTNMIDCSDDAILWVIDLSDLWYWKWSINKLKVVHKQTRYSLLRPSISCLTFQVPQADHGSVVSQRGLGDFSGRRFGRLPWHLEVSPEMGDSKRHQTYGCFIGKMMTGWWFEPRWKIWVRQLAWLYCQLNGKIQTTNQMMNYWALRYPKSNTSMI